MSESLKPGFITRVRYTPLRDVVRGRMTGRLNVNRRIDAAGLPGPAGVLVKRVVRHTRLWRLERVAVADELIAHFADGLADGETADGLVSSFGDERTAAALIRRAKRRARPAAVRAAVVAGKIVGLLAIAYAATGVYFLTGRATPTVDYVAGFNAPVLAVAPAERAWPVYRAAILTLPPKVGDAEYRFYRLLDTIPGQRRWPELTQWLDDHTETVRLIREAAAKPRLGYLIGPGGSGDDPELWPEEAKLKAQVPPDALRNRMRELNDYHHIGNLRVLSSVLAAHARLARERDDAAGVFADLTAGAGIGRHMRNTSLLMVQRWADASGLSFRELERTLLQKPGLLTDAHLRDIAHILSGPETAADLYDLSGERAAFRHAVQLTYTDNGNGDGRITAAGVKRFGGYYGNNEWYDASNPLGLLFTPAVFAVSASRADVIATFDRMCDAIEGRLPTPLRELEDESFDPFEALKSSPFNRMRYMPVVRLDPGANWLNGQAERFLARRDAVVVAIALELHHRHTGAYPKTLAELTPGFLPEVPVDRIAGGPLRYRIVENKPLIYSLGDDRDDDAGRLPVNRDGSPNPRLAAVRSGADGDWVLYPDPDEYIPEEEPEHEE